jgi:hypothetical protein
LGVAPLISRGGKTTPGGALISSSAAMASPFVADGAILGNLWETGRVESWMEGQAIEVSFQHGTRYPEKIAALPYVANQRRGSFSGGRPYPRYPFPVNLCQWLDSYNYIIQPISYCHTANSIKGLQLRSYFRGQQHKTIKRLTLKESIISRSLIYPLRPHA